MRRDDLRAILKRATEITGDRDFVVVGSQSIHGAFSRPLLPDPATASLEADLMPLHDDSGDKAVTLVGKAGEGSGFDHTYGVQIDAVDISTSALPTGWVDRLVPFLVDDSPNTTIGWCLEPHDLVVAKAIAGRAKDRSFINAVVKASLADPAECIRRMWYLDQGCATPTPGHLATAVAYLESLPRPQRLFNVAAPKLPTGRERPKREDFPPTVDMWADLRGARPTEQQPIAEAVVPRQPWQSGGHWNRHSAGTPNGGQFAPGYHPESDVELDLPPDD